MLLNLDSPLVSVIIPTYNRPNYLIQAIASAVQQTYKNIEIIVSDDCSTESPAKTIESFQDSRIRFRRNANNLGISRNVIAAFKEARGKYVASLNDDDIWNENFLEKLVPHLDANPDLVIAFSDHYIMDSDGKIDYAATEENTQRWKRDQLKEGVYQPFYEIALVHQAVPSALATVIRKDAIEWNDFLPEMGSYWDLYLTYLACRNGGGAYYCPERLSRYRVHFQSETFANGDMGIQSKIRAGKAGIYCYRQFMEDEQLQEFKSYFREKWLQAHTTLAIGLLLVKQPAKARPYLLHTLTKQKLNLRTIVALILSFIPVSLTRKWRDYTGLLRSYKSWNIFVGNRHDNTENQLVPSIKKQLDWLQKYMSVDTVTLLLPTTDKQNLFVSATLGLEEEIKQQIRIPIGRGFAGRIAANIEPIIVNDMSAIEIFSPILREKGLKSLVGVPLAIKQGVIGVLHVGTFEFHQFTQDDVKQLQLIAHRIKLIIMNAEVFDFAPDSHNQESCLLVKGFRKYISYINTLEQVLIDFIGFTLEEASVIKVI